MEINGSQNCLVTNILQNIFFCALQKKVSYTGLEQHDFHFWVNCAFKVHLFIPYTTS